MKKIAKIESLKVTQIEIGQNGNYIDWNFDAEKSTLELFDQQRKTFLMFQTSEKIKLLKVIAFPAVKAMSHCFRDSERTLVLISKALSNTSLSKFIKYDLFNNQEIFEISFRFPNRSVSGDVIQVVKLANGVFLCEQRIPENFSAKNSDFKHSFMLFWARKGILIRFPSIIWRIFTTGFAINQNQLPIFLTSPNRLLLVILFKEKLYIYHILSLKLIRILSLNTKTTKITLHRIFFIDNKANLYAYGTKRYLLKKAEVYTGHLMMSLTSLQVQEIDSELHLDKPSELFHWGDKLFALQKDTPRLNISSKFGTKVFKIEANIVNPRFATYDPGSDRVFFLSNDKKTTFLNQISLL